MENYPSLEEFENGDSYQGFFTSEIVNSIAESFSYKDEIFHVGLQLGISHSISIQYLSRYDNITDYAVDIILLWRETYNSGDFEACRKLEYVLRHVGFRGKAARVVSGFLKWVNGHVCCRDIVEKNAKYAITKLSKSNKSTGLRQSVVDKFNKWCKQQRLENNNFNMALYFQLYGSQLYEEREQEFMKPFKTILTYLNTSMKHHLPHDAFYLTVVTNLDMDNNVAISSTYLVKEITEFLHPRRLGKICDSLTDMDIVCQLAHTLEVPNKIVERAKYRHNGSMLMVSYDVLYAWKQDCPFIAEEDQVECLIDALKEIDMDGVAYELEKDYKAWEQSPCSEFQICNCMKNKKRPIGAVVDVNHEGPVKTKSSRMEM